MWITTLLPTHPQAQQQVIDLLPAFREAAQKDTLYINQDSHWNKAGNLLAAKKIMSYMEHLYRGENRSIEMIYPFEMTIALFHKS